MPLIYSLIAKNEIVLAEYTENIGNFPSIARFLLKKIDWNLNKQSYTYDEYCFHFLICDSNVVFMAMTDRIFGLTIPYEYLFDIRSKTLCYIKELKNPVTLILNEIVSPILREKMIYWNIPEHSEYDKLATQLSSIQNILIENIDILLERGEKLDILVSKTKNLTMESNIFRRQSQRFQENTQWLQRKKTVLIILIFLIVYLMLVLNCKTFSLNKCFYYKENNKNINNLKDKMIISIDDLINKLDNVKIGMEEEIKNEENKILKQLKEDINLKIIEQELKEEIQQIGKEIIERKLDENIARKIENKDIEMEIKN